MKRALGVGISAALVAAPVALLAGPAGVSAATPAARSVVASHPTAKLASIHRCANNGITCFEPYQPWHEFKGFNYAVSHGAHISEYIGHDEPAVLFYSKRPGSGNNVSYQMRLPTDPPTRPTQTGSGGTYGFQLHPAFWFGMVVCDPNGSPNPDGKALTGHATPACTPDSNNNIYASTNPKSPRYFGLAPGQAYEELQLYPPGWVPWPSGNSCTAKQWCAALNIFTFNINQNTGQFNNTACLNSVGPEPGNFAFLTKSGVATASASPANPTKFIPVPGKDLLMSSGDSLSVRLSDTGSGLRAVINDHTTHATGSMTASAANGFSTVLFDPTATTCTVTPVNYHPEFSTSSPLTRNVAAAHTYNIAFTDEIGHFEYCGKVGSDPLGTCLQPLGADTNNGDNHGPDPAGDDDFCLPGSASLDVKINGCTDIDGDFDGVAYNFTWPGSITNPIADRLLHPTSQLFSSPTTGGHNFDQSAFEADISRNESSDTAFRVDVPCQRHIQNPADPHPGVGCVNPPPNSVFYPIYTTRNTPAGCMWQEGGAYIPGTTNTFGGNSHAEYGPLRAISYPTAPLGLVTKRFNDFRSNPIAVPCLAR
jgi:hypothetical protein